MCWKVILSTILGTISISFGILGTFSLDGPFLDGAWLVSVEIVMAGPYS